MADPDFSVGHVRSGALALRYVAWGPPAAPPVILLHGLRAYAHWFDSFAAAGKERFRLVALDQRGRGGSDWSPTGAYDTASYVADVEALADDLGFARFSLVGHSMGGTNAINFAARHPHRVAALVIVDSAPVLDQKGLTRIRAELGATPARFNSRGEAKAFLRRLHGRASDASLETRLDWMLQADAGGGLSAGLSWRIDPKIFDPKMTPDPPERTWEALRRITCPTLIVRGAVSDLVSRESVAAMVSAMANARSVEVADAAHMVVEDNPDGFNAVTLPFLAQTLGVAGDASSPPERQRAADQARSA